MRIAYNISPPVNLFYLLSSRPLIRRLRARFGQIEFASSTHRRAGRLKWFRRVSSLRFLKWFPSFPSLPLLSAHPFVSLLLPLPALLPSYQRTKMTNHSDKLTRQRSSLARSGGPLLRRAAGANERRAELRQDVAFNRKSEGKEGGREFAPAAVAMPSFPCTSYFMASFSSTFLNGELVFSETTNCIGFNFLGTRLCIPFLCKRAHVVLPRCCIFNASTNVDILFITCKIRLPCVPNA